MSRAAAVPPAYAVHTRYRLVRRDNGDWSLRRDGVERCLWNAAWPAAAILRIAALAVLAETRGPVVWRRMAFAGRPVVYVLTAAPARDARAHRSARTGPRRVRPGPGAGRPA